VCETGEEAERIVLEVLFQKKKQLKTEQVYRISVAGSMQSRLRDVRSGDLRNSKHYFLQCYKNLIAVKQQNCNNCLGCLTFRCMKSFFLYFFWYSWLVDFHA